MKDKKNETAGIPHDKFEHDLDLPEDTDSRYSPEYLKRRREMIERLKQEQEKEVNDMTQNMKQDTGEPNLSAPNNGKTTNEQTTASSGMTREELMRRLSADPRCRIVKPSGKGFVIGGVKPPSERY